MQFNLSNPIKRLSRVYGNIQKALAAAERVFEVLDTKPEIEDMPGAVALPTIEGYVALNNVTFEYKAGEPALRQLSLKSQSRPGSSNCGTEWCRKNHYCQSNTAIL